MTKRKSSRATSITKLAATSTVRVLLLLAVVLVALSGCSNCENSVKSETTSPDGRLVARTCERNCGATTDFSDVVNLQSASAKFDSNDGVLFVAKGQYDVSTKWTGPKSLLITCKGCSRSEVFREVSIDGDIDVSYVFGSK